MRELSGRRAGWRSLWPCSDTSAGSVPTRGTRVLMVTAMLRTRSQGSRHGCTYSGTVSNPARLEYAGITSVVQWKRPGNRDHVGVKVAWWSRHCHEGCTQCRNSWVGVRRNHFGGPVETTRQPCRLVGCRSARAEDVLDAMPFFNV